MKQITNARVRGRATMFIFNAPKSVRFQSFYQSFSKLVETGFKKLVFYHVFEDFSQSSNAVFNKGSNPDELKVFYAIVYPEGSKGVDIMRPAVFFVPLLEINCVYKATYLLSHEEAACFSFYVAECASNQTLVGERRVQLPKFSF